MFSIRKEKLAQSLVMYGLLGAILMTFIGENIISHDSLTWKIGAISSGFLILNGVYSFITEKYRKNPKK